MEFLGTRISFRALERRDIPSIVRWQQAPHAIRWFASDPTDVAVAEAEFAPCIDGTEPTWVHVIEIDGVDVGYMQHYSVGDYGDYLAAVGGGEVAGIDYLIGEESYTGRGLGPRVIKRYVEEIVVPNLPAIERVVSSPDPENIRSIRALEKAGFRQVATIVVNGNDERLCVLDVRASSRTSVE